LLKPPFEAACINEVAEVVEDALIKAVELRPLPLLPFVIAGKGAASAWLAGD
jgi:hypothetical protein